LCLSKLSLRARLCQPKHNSRVTSELIGNGFFGSEAPSRRLLDRVGNLVILPYARETVWWYEPERFVQSSYGHHGGLTPEEMETPLFCYAL